MWWLSFSFIVTIVLFLCVFLVRPNRKRSIPQFEHKRFAHRGLHSGDSKIPENSIPAFRLAAAHGYGVELDVRLTADKQLVVFHDADLSRMCGVDRTVSQCTYEELSQFRLLESGEKIPLFADVLDVLGGMPVVCEIKADRPSKTEICEAVYGLLEGYPGEMCIESFSPYVVSWFRRNHSDIIRGQLSMNFLKTRNNLSIVTAFLMSTFLMNWMGRPDFIAYRHQDKDFFAFRIIKKMFAPLCIAWTVRSREEEKDCFDEFSSIIFEDYRP